MTSRRSAPPIPVPPLAPAHDGTLRPARGVLLRFPSLCPDVARNAAWDDLLAHAEQAWMWRDADSLTSLAACLLRLAEDVVPEWIGPDTDV